MVFWGKLFGKFYSSEEIADAVVYEITKDASVHIRDRDFQTLLDWNELSEEDKAQIHIELELSGIAFAYLLLEALEEHLEHPVSKESARSVRNDLVSAFMRHIAQDMPQQRLREAVAQSIARRCEECRHDFERRKKGTKARGPKANLLDRILRCQCPKSPACRPSSCGAGQRSLS